MCYGHQEARLFSTLKSTSYKKSTIWTDRFFLGIKSYIRVIHQSKAANFYERKGPNLIWFVDSWKHPLPIQISARDEK